jgi:S1-C subfamily serine protease
LGVRVADNGGLTVKAVLRSSAAERAGLAAGDELLAVDDWRLRKLDDLSIYLGPAAEPRRARLLVSRDQRLKTLTVEIPAGLGSVVLVPADPASDGELQRRRAWLKAR